MNKSNPRETIARDAMHIRIGKFLAEIRKVSGVTQLEISLEIGKGTTIQYCSNVECGRANASIEYLVAWQKLTKYSKKSLLEVLSDNYKFFLLEALNW